MSIYGTSLIFLGYISEIIKLVACILAIIYFTKHLKDGK